MENGPRHETATVVKLATQSYSISAVGRVMDGAMTGIMRILDGDAFEAARAAINESCKKVPQLALEALENQAEKNVKLCVAEYDRKVAELEAQQQANQLKFEDEMQQILPVDTAMAEFEELRSNERDYDTKLAELKTQRETYAAMAESEVIQSNTKDYTAKLAELETQWETYQQQYKAKMQNGSQITAMVDPATPHTQRGAFQQQYDREVGKLLTQRQAKELEVCSAKRKLTAVKFTPFRAPEKAQARQSSWPRLRRSMASLRRREHCST